MAIGTGAAILAAGGLGAAASIRSSRQQSSATNNAARTTTEATNVARRDLQPFRDLGGEAINPLMDFAGTPIDDSVERDNIIREVQNTAAARGKLNSGGTINELGRQLFGLNQRNRSQRFNELFDLVTLGSNAAAGQATATRGGASTNAEFALQGANARAAGTVGASNNISNSLLMMSLLNR